MYLKNANNKTKLYKISLIFQGERTVLTGEIKNINLLHIIRIALIQISLINILKIVTIRKYCKK